MTRQVVNQVRRGWMTANTIADCACVLLDNILDRLIIGQHRAACIQNVSGCLNGLYRRQVGP